MPATISTTVGLSAKDATTKFDVPKNVAVKTETQNLQRYDAGIIIVGSGAEEDLPVDADVTTFGWLLLHNLDPTNYVKYGPKSAGVMVPYGRLKPGDRHLVRLEPGITIRWQANGADVPVDMTLVND